MTVEIRTIVYLVFRTEKYYVTTVASEAEALEMCDEETDYEAVVISELYPD